MKNNIIVILLFLLLCAGIVISIGYKSGDTVYKDMNDKIKFLEKELDKKDNEIQINTQFIQVQDELLKAKELLLKNEKNSTKKYKNLFQEAKSNLPGIYQSHIERIVESTLKYLNESNIKDWTRLLTITITTESDMGKYLKQLKGPAVGITQVEPETERHALDWMCNKERKTYDKIKKLRVPAKVSIHEAEYNLAYSIALAYSTYRMRKVDPKNKSIKELVELYKIHFNTIKGKATIEGVLNKLTKFGVI